MIETSFFEIVFRDLLLELKNMEALTTDSRNQENNVIDFAEYKRRKVGE